MGNIPWTYWSCALRNVDGYGTNAQGHINDIYEKGGQIDILQGYIDQRINGHSIDINISDREPYLGMCEGNITLKEDESTYRVEKDGKPNNNWPIYGTVSEKDIRDAETLILQHPKRPAVHKNSQEIL